MRTPPRIFIEILEARIAPAGIVTVLETSPGEFTLTGDAVDNQVSIFQTTPGAFRIEGLAGTTLNPGGVTSMDITNLTKLTLIGNDGSDNFSLANIGSLTTLSVDGGVGNDAFTGINLRVNGSVNLSGGTGADVFNLDGLTTNISGNLTLTDSGNSINGNLNAENTFIGGSLIVNGSNGTELLSAAGAGRVTIANGLDFDSGPAGPGTLQFFSQNKTRIGTLATGESFLFAGAEGGTATFGTGKYIFEGGIRVNGGSSVDQLIFNSPSRVVKIGALPTGQSIAFNGGAGTDNLVLIAKNGSLAGGIDFNGGDGGTSMSLSSVNGRIAIGKLATKQSIKLTGGVDADNFTMDVSNLVLSGGVEFAAGEGNNLLTLSGANGAATIGRISGGASIKYTGGSGSDSATITFAELTLAGGIDFVGGDGTNDLTENVPNGVAKIGKLAPSGAGASIKYSGGSGSDTISTTNRSLNLVGGTDIVVGAGTNSVTFGGPNGRLFVGTLTTGQSFKYVGGASIDSFTTNVANALFAGGLDFTGDDGANSINFSGNSGAVTVGKLASGESILYSGGGGGDSFSSGQSLVTLAGGIDFSPGNGNNSVSFDSAGTLRFGTIATGQSIKFAGGNDADSVFLGGPLISLNGSIEMTGDSGENRIDLDGAATTVGRTAAGVSILLAGGSGLDAIDFEDTLTLAGSLTLDGGAGDDFLDLTGINRLNTGGAVTFNGGSDDDTFNINAFALSISNGLTYNAGDGVDDFSFIADGTVRGDVVVNLGGATVAAEDQAVTLTSRNGLVPGLFVKGALTITGTGDAVTTDTLTITNVSVTKAFNASLGSGVSTVVIDNLRARDTFTLATGNGADVVNIERNNIFGNSIISKIANIQTGNDADTVNIGDTVPAPNSGPLDSTRVRFLGGLTVDGGAGADTINNVAGENDFPGGPPTIISF